MLSVFGGKITTFRKLAEEAVDMIAPKLGNHRGSWTANACLPGGDLFGSEPQNRSVLEFDGYVHELQKKFSWLAPKLIARYARTYGTRIHVLLNNRHTLHDMGEPLAEGLYPAELEYLMNFEWASSSTDILWRRTKLGLHVPEGTAQKVDEWFAAKRYKNDNKLMVAAG